MRIERAQHARMSESGSSLLRLIQNHEMPILDLLVRESVQNSLDASLSRERSAYVDVHFYTGSFDPIRLGQRLEEISEALRSRYGTKEQSFLAIRDIGTMGLTGPLHFDQVRNNEFGNLLKLVYEISKPQQREGAGGSWGLGKTVFFRVGIGLVLYYSRIKVGRNYESRLAACLVEDEKASNALLKSSSHLDRGIAWWGQEYGKNSTVPITDEEKIREILDMFSICPYTDDQTGTTIIIPFVSEQDLLLDASDLDASSKKHQNYPWMQNAAEYLILSLQRWYAPRLMNPSYAQGKYLRAFVNDEPITVNTMFPIFQTIQSLYNRTEAIKSTQLQGILSEQDIEVNLDNISLNKVFKNGSKAGQIAFVKMSRRQLKMEAPCNNANPFVHLTHISHP